MNSELYFAYGSNLNAADLRRRIGADFLQFRSVGYLGDHDLAFTYRSGSREGGVLDVVRRRGQVVPGAVFEVSTDGWRTLDAKEGVGGKCYERCQAVAFDEKSNEVPVTTYCVCEAKREAFVAPTPNYLGIVRAGMREYGISCEQLNTAAENLPTPWLVEGIFCYGTLMRGECRCHMLEAFAVESITDATTSGDLIHLGSFPGLVEPATSKRLVHGELVRVKNLGEALVELDRVEGFHGYDCDEECLYRRALVNVRVDGRTVKAWTYCYAQGYSRDRLIESGSWRERVASQS